MTDSIIRIGEVMGHYKYMPLPWCNKSRMGSSIFCERSFWLQEKASAVIKPINEEMANKTVMGTNAHLVISLFNGEIRKRDMIKDLMKMPLDHETKNSTLYWAMVALCNEIMPEEARAVEEFNIVISNYCEWQVQNWLAVSRMFGQKESAYKKYWLSLMDEVFLIDEEHQYFGTLDAVYNNPNYERDDIPYLIAEFKSKKPGKDVREYKGENAFSVKIPTDKMMELHFEAFLAANGKIPKKKQDENGKIVEVMEKAFPLANSYKDFIPILVFLGDEVPYAAPKKPNARTMENVHVSVQQLRVKWQENEDNINAWPGKFNDYICPHCMVGAECTELRMKEMIRGGNA